MASLEELDAATPDVPDVAAATVAQAATVAAEAASAGGELDPELDADFHVDPAYTTSMQFEVSNYLALKSLRSLSFEYV